MAGSLNSDSLKKLPRCHHGSACVLKTGTSKNSSYGKSFFICNSSEGRCSFATHAKDFESTVCPQHLKMVELKAFAKKENGVRCYYRCTSGKEIGETWCGYELVQPVQQQHPKAVLKDITNCPKPVERTKDVPQKSVIINPLAKAVIKSKDDISNKNTNISEKQTINKDSSAVIPALPCENNKNPNIIGNDVSKKSIFFTSVNKPSQSSRPTGRLTSIIDMNRASFNVPRDARISDVSETSSTNSSHLSEKSNNETNEMHNGDADHVSHDAEINDNIIESSMLSNKSDESDNDDSLNDTASSMFSRKSDESDNDDNDDPLNDTASSMLSKKSDESDNDDSLNDSAFVTATDNSKTIDKNNVPLHVNPSNIISKNTSNNADKLTIEKTVFNIPNNAVVSSSNTGKQSTVEEPRKKCSNIIEISDSSDDEEDNVVIADNADMSKSKDTRGKSPPVVTIPSISNNSWMGMLNKMEHIKMQIRKQQELYVCVGHKVPDGGKRILEDITRLSKELDQMKLMKAQYEKNGVVKPHGSRPINSHFLPASSGSIQYTDLPRTTEFFGHPGQERTAPLFGGRMTETRLKEVGRITKGSIEQLHKSLDSCPAPTEEAKEPDGLNVSLMTHQKQALAWLLWREKQVPSGGILADDMGLGKTLTMIALTLKSKQDETSKIKELPSTSKLIFSKGTVIICPASLIHQWHKEIEKRVQSMNLTVCIYHGPNREKRVKRLALYNIVLTTYNISSIEGKKFAADDKAKPKEQLSEWMDSTQSKVTEGPLFKIFWRRIILDEGHSIKNHKTGSSLAICHLEGESRWIVTGTPIQNNTMELYSLIKFLRVSPFDELKVWKREVDNRCSSGTKRMNSIVASLLLRRTKDQADKKTGKPLIALPTRTAIVHKLKLSTDESAVYDLVQSYSKIIFKKFLDNRKDAFGESTNPVDNATKSDETYKMPTSVLGMDIDEALSMLGLRGSNTANQGCLLVLVLRLRQCCTHLSLMCEAIDADLCKSEGIDLPIEESFCNLSIDESTASLSRPRQLMPTFQSSKITTLLSCLSELRKKSTTKPIKSVIVSQWTRMLDIIAYHLRCDGYRYDFITGSVNVKKRSDIVENFNNDKYPEVMLVSLRAGGVGLNLIGGSHLFLLDQHWNPALEDQASDRIYRVGQKNDVVVHRFLCLDTVEERILQLQEKKKLLANSVLYGGKTQKLTLQDLKMIFGLGL